MTLDYCRYCDGRVGQADQWEDTHGVLWPDIHIRCGMQFIDIPARLSAQTLT